MESKIEHEFIMYDYHLLTIHKTVQKLYYSYSFSPYFLSNAIEKCNLQNLNIIPILRTVN